MVNKSNKSIFEEEEEVEEISYQDDD